MTTEELRELASDLWVVSRNTLSVYQGIVAQAAAILERLACDDTIQAALEAQGVAWGDEQVGEDYIKAYRALLMGEE